MEQTSNDMPEGGEGNLGKKPCLLTGTSSIRLDNLKRTLFQASVKKTLVILWKIWFDNSFWSQATITFYSFATPLSNISSWIFVLHSSWLAFEIRDTLKNRKDFSHRLYVYFFAFLKQLLECYWFFFCYGLLLALCYSSLVDVYVCVCWSIDAFTFVILFSFVYLISLVHGVNVCGRRTYVDFVLTGLAWLMFQYDCFLSS